MKDLIDIHVNEHKVGNQWFISALAVNDREKDEYSPEEFGVMESSPSEKEALDFAEEWASSIIESKAAKTVVIFLNGNEHKYFDADLLVPNLDCMEQEDLRNFWMETNTTRPLKKAKSLFPDKPKGYVTATKSLGHYAINKATAMHLREKGDIQGALTYESICGTIYKNLPEYAKW